MNITGTYQIVEWNETTDQTFGDGVKLSTAAVKQTYSGDLIGNSDIKYQLCYSADGNATFTGFETISVQGDEGEITLILQHNGKFEQGIASSQFIIVGGSGHSNLLGKTGSFSSKEGGTAVYTITC